MGGDSQPHDEEFAANTTVIENARELGLLRHRQQGFAPA
jgi:hypothetical protein